MTLPLHNLCSLFLLAANCCAISSLSRMYSRPLSPAYPLSHTLTLSLERQPLALHSRLGGKPPTVPGPCQSVQGASRQRHTLLHQACLGQDAEVHSPWRRPVRGPARDGGERGARGMRADGNGPALPVNGVQEERPERMSWGRTGRVDGCGRLKGGGPEVPAR